MLKNYYFFRNFESVEKVKMHCERKKNNKQASVKIRLMKLIHLIYLLQIIYRYSDLKPMKRTKKVVINHNRLLVVITNLLVTFITSYYI
jgi:hypothetical protein